MSLFGDKQTVYLKYQINLTDPVQVDALRTGGGAHDGSSGGATTNICPLPPNFPPGTPANVPGTPNPAGKGADALFGLRIEPNNVGTFTYPCINSEWFVSDGSNDFPWNQTGFTRKSGGWFGIPGLFGDTTTFFWRGEFNFVPPAMPNGVIVAPMPARHFIDGFELPPAGEGGSGNASLDSARRASRSTQGYGLSLDCSTLTKTHSRTAGGAAAAAAVWDRFYIRPRRFPAAASVLWQSSGSPSGLSGAQIALLPSGQLAMSAVDSGGAGTLLSTTAVPLVLHTWQKIDILTTYANGSAGRLQVYVNNASVADLTVPTATGGLQGTSCSATTIGSPNANTACLEIDDWIGADAPPSTHTSADWVNGSRVVLVRPTGRAASDDGNWTGDWRTLLQRPVGQATPTALTSAIASARLAVKTDAGSAVDQEPSALGYAAIAVGCYSTRTAADGQLGYKLPGGVDVLAAPIEGSGGAFAWSVILNRPGPSTGPITPLAGLELVHIKSAAADAASVAALGAAVELIGAFGPEDTLVSPGSVQRAPIGVHNAPYPRTPWARKGIAPISPVGIVGGTYVGNATAQNLTFRFPVHFLWIRPVSVAPAGGLVWWSSLNSAHVAGATRNQAEAIADVCIDPDFVPVDTTETQQQQTVVRIAGSHSEVNANGVTYQYIAFCDPGLRFCDCSALWEASIAADFVSHLDSDIFTPEFAIFLREQEGTSSTVELYTKGLGHAATNVSPIGAGELASAVSFSNGTITSKSAFHAANLTQIGYIAFRRDDHSGDTGVPRVLQLASYTGDGSASRTIGLAPISGVRPLFAMVVPHNVATFYRDPSHTGTTSTQYPNTANASTGITGAGIDSLTVGSSLNSNGVVYDVFVLPGDSTAGNNGFSINGEFIPVAPGNPETGPGTPFDPTPLDPEQPSNPPPSDGGPPPGGNPGDDNNFGTDCVSASLRIVNIALSRLGISKRIANLVTDLSEEADTCRLHYSEDADATLRDFPWPFATRYADLVLVAGTAAAPVNKDWQYSYRTPANMMKARRVVNPNGVGRDYDARPPKFRLGGDDLGDLIYCNESAVNLEYTIRPTCPATAGDAIFRSALAWRHAHSISGALARDDKKTLYCWQMYQALLGQAATMASQEQQQAPQGGPDWLDDRSGIHLGPDPWGRG